MSVVSLAFDDGLAVLTIDNPPLNLFSQQVTDELDHAIDDVATSSVRALLIRSEGRQFMAGADVRIFHDTTAAQARVLFSRNLAMLARLEELPIPTVCAVQGLCLAAGLELMLATDIAVAAESAQFAQVERHIGTTTLLGGVHRLAERAGSARAKQIVFDGDRYSARQFADWNIVNHVVPDDELVVRAMELARHYAHGPTKALAAGKALVRAYLEGGVRSGDREVLVSGVELFASRDMHTGVAKVLNGGSKDIAKNTDFIGA